MTISARSSFVMACLATVLLVACGGGEQETRTIVETVAPEQPPVPGPDQAPPTGQTPAARESLPPGVVGADGTYAMTVDDFRGKIAEDDTRPAESEWTFSTSCAGPGCEIEMRRELQSGGSKSLTLLPAEGREDVFEAKSSGETQCGNFAPQEPAPTDQRYSIKLNAPRDVGGRVIATRIEAYLTEESDGCTDQGGSGAVSWTGVLAP
jgi:hypothetical protein